MTFDLQLLNNSPERLAEQIERIEKTERLAMLQKRDKAGQSVLSQAIEYPESLIVLLNSLPVEHRLELLTTIDYQESVICRASTNSKLLNLILNSVPEAQHLELVEAKNFLGTKVIDKVISNPDSLRLILDVYFKAGQTKLILERLRTRPSLLAIAAPNTDSLKMMLELLYEDALQEELLLKAGEILHSAASNTDSLKIILERISNKEQLQNLILSRDNFQRQTALHRALPNAESLKLLLDLIPSERRLNIILNNDLLHYAAAEPKCLVVILNSLPEEQRINAVKSSLGRSIFYSVAAKPESLQVILNVLTNEQIKLLTEQVDSYDQTVLHYAVSCPESLKMILSLLPQEARLTAVHSKWRESVLHLAAATNPEALQVILDLLPQNQHLEAVKIMDKMGRMTLHHAAANDRSLNTVLNVIPQEQHLEAIQTKDKMGRMVLSHAAPNHESLNIILSILPNSQHRTALITTDEMGRRVWHYAAPNPESLKIINGKLKKEDLALLTEIDREGRTLLDYAELNPQSLNVIMQACQDAQRLNLLKPQDQKVESLLFKAEEKLECLTVFFDLLPMTQAIEALYIQNKSGETILHRVAGKPEFLEAILNKQFTELDTRLEGMKRQYNPANHFGYIYEGGGLYEAQRKQWQAFQCKDKNGQTVLHRAVENLQSLKIILKKCPNDMLFSVADNSGETILHKAAYKPEYLDYLLGQYTQSTRIAAMTKANGAGNTVLHNAISTPESLKILLKEYPKELAWKEKTRLNKEGESPLYLAAAHPDALKILLGDYPAELLYDGLAQLDAKGQSVLHLAAENTESLKILLEHYPKDLLFAGLTQADRKGLWPLHRAVNTPDSLRLIQEHLTEQMFLDALDQQNEQGNSMLYHLQEPQSLKIVLSAYDEKSRLGIITAKNKQNISILSSITNRLDLLSSMLSCFPALVDEDGNLVVSQEHLKLFFEIDSPSSLMYSENDISPALFVLNMLYVSDKKFQLLPKSTVDSSSDPMNHHAHDAIRTKRAEECYAILKNRYQEKYTSYRDLSLIECLFKQDILSRLRAGEEKLGDKGSQAIIALLSDKNIRDLASGTNTKLNDLTRELLTSNDDVYHIAWRAYDKESPILKKAYPKYFAGVRDQTRKLTKDEKNESDFIRELTAYLYLSANDMAVVSTEDGLLDALILHVAESSRAHSPNKDSIDGPSCYAGTIARLSLATRSNPLFSLENESLESLVYLKTQTIVQQILNEFFTDEQRETKEKEGIYTSTFTLGLQQLNELLTSSPLSQKVISVTGEEYDLQELTKYRALFLKNIKNRDTFKIIVNHLNEEKEMQCDPFLVEYYMYAALFHLNTMRLSLTRAQQRMLLKLDPELDSDSDHDLGSEATLGDSDAGFGSEKGLDTTVESESETILDTAARSMPYPKPVSTQAKMKLFAPNVIEQKIALAQHLLYEVFKQQKLPQEIAKHLVALIINGKITQLDELENKLRTRTPELEDFMRANYIPDDIVTNGLDEVFESIFRASEARGVALTSPFSRAL